MQISCAIYINAKIGYAVSADDIVPNIFRSAVHTFTILTRIPVKPSQNWFSTWTLPKEVRKERLLSTTREVNWTSNQTLHTVAKAINSCPEESLNLKHFTILDSNKQGATWSYVKFHLQKGEIVWYSPKNRRIFDWWGVKFVAVWKKMEWSTWSYGGC